MDEIREIIERITERYENPIRVGSRCEAKTFYRVEDLSERDLEILAGYIADRIVKVCAPQLPQVVISLPGSYTGLARLLSKELAPPGESLELVSVEQLSSATARAGWLRNTNAILVNEVITTARSCLEVHTKGTIMGASILCWAALIDRTFGPGPVPVVAAHTGDPVILFEELP